jgi:hypothetical protein
VLCVESCVRMRQAAAFVVYEYFSREVEFGNIFTDRTLFTGVSFIRQVLLAYLSE